MATSSMVEPSVYIVLLNWNGWRDTVQCIRSLKQMEYRNWRAIVVDNGSTDDSIERLREVFPDILILETGENLGFAAGNNVGIRHSLGKGADYVFVLNNDTTVFRDTVLQLVKFAEDHLPAGMMSPKIHRHEPFKEWPVRRRLDFWTVLCAFSPLRRLVVHIPGLYTRFYYTGSDPELVYFLPGSALFFRASALGVAGLFDENTFLDFEELIIAEKVRAAGLSVYFVPQAAVRHKGSASGSKLRARRYIENARSEAYFLSEYVTLSKMSVWAIKVVRLVTYSLRALRHENYREHFKEFTGVLLTNSYEPAKRPNSEVI